MNQITASRSLWIPQPFHHWFFRFKIYHLPFWFIYHCLSWTLITGNIEEVANNILHTPYSIKFSFYVLFQAFGVYFNLYYLIPRFLEKGRYIPYIALLVLTILSTAAVIVTGYYASAFISGRTFQELYFTNPENYFYFFKVNSLPSTIASMTLAMSIKLTKNWVQSERRQQTLEKEKLETELKFLKHQFNPHFLFNTINSIFFLIHKNPDKASDSLAKFSDLLRYQLYECNDLQIPLHQEITYLHNFIELEKLRRNRSLEIAVDMDGVSSDHSVVAPFILMTFVENAFKHVSTDADRKNRIKIKLILQEDLLSFTVSNSKSSYEFRDVIPYSGIGLKNVQRRLDLLYPEKHQLTITNSHSQFEVHLQLRLHRVELNEGTRISSMA